MKKLKYIIYALVIGGLFFASCDQYGDQDVAEPGGYEQDSLQDNTFVIEAVLSSYTIDSDAAEDSVELLTVTTAPELIDSAASISYELQLSSSESFPDTIVPDISYNNGSVKVLNDDLNTIVLDMSGSDGESEIFMRLIAYVTEGGLKTMEICPTSDGNEVISLLVTPFSVLKPYTEVETMNPYYIIGLGDGNWTNSTSGLGVSIFPLGLTTGDVYNSDGEGTFVYTGYFSASSGFKLIGTIGSWDEQWGSSDGALTPVHNDGSSSNFYVPSDGYYTITLNSITDELTIEEASVSPSSYTSIGMIGDINSWGSDEAMTATGGTENHVWYLTYTFESDYSDGVKFRADASWDTNWGANEFPHGIGTSGGSNIPYTAGTYIIFFNDISGCYYFIAQ